MAVQESVHALQERLANEQRLVHLIDRIHSAKTLDSIFIEIQDEMLTFFDADRMTLYAHLSRVDLKRGQRVEQGQRVGTVGATGWATGPHLHFEFRLRGQHQDPTRIARSSEPQSIGGASRARFEEAVRMVQRQLDIAETLRDSSGQGE